MRPQVGARQSSTVKCLRAILRTPYASIGIVRLPLLEIAQLLSSQPPESTNHLLRAI